MAKKWAEVAASDGFKALAPDQQDGARKQYFDEVVAPQVPTEHVGAAWNQFSTDAGVGRRELPAGVKPSTAGAGRGAMPDPRSLDAPPPMNFGMGGGAIMEPEKPQRASVLEGMQMLELPFDSAEADKLSNRKYAEANDPANPRPRAMARTEHELRESPTIKNRSAVRAVGDIGLGVTQGALGLVKGIADNLSAGDNVVSNFYGNAIDSAERLKSDDLRNQQIQRDSEIAIAERNAGQVGGARAAFNSMFRHPSAGLDVIARGAGSIVPTMAMGAAGAGTKIMGAVNALSNAGDAASQTADVLRKLPQQAWARDDDYLKLLSQGATHEEAVSELAPMRAITAQAMGGLTGALSGSTGLEKVLAGKAIGNSVRNRIGRAGAELAGEQAETLLPQVVGNAAVANLDQETSLFKGLGQAAVETAAGTLPGAALAARNTSEKSQQNALDLAKSKGFLVREERIKTLRDAGETAAADLFQQKHEKQTTLETVDGEIAKLPGNADFAQQYRDLRVGGMKPAESAARSAVAVTYKGIAADNGVSEKAMGVALGAAKDMPLDKVPGFLHKFTDSLVKRGLVTPNQSMAEIGTSLEAARDDAMDAAVNAVYQPVQPVMNDAIALEDKQSTPEPAQDNVDGQIQATPEEAPDVSMPTELPAVATGTPASGYSEFAGGLDSPVGDGNTEQPAVESGRAVDQRSGDAVPLADGRPADAVAQITSAEQANSTKSVPAPSVSGERGVVKQTLTTGDVSTNPEKIDSFQKDVKESAKVEQVHLGRDNIPLTEGGKAFQTRKAADDARKLNTGMRVVRAEGGYALTEKTPAQIAAQDAAAKRLSQPRTSPAGEPIPAHSFIASEGGLAPDTRADMGMQGNVTVGNRKLFASEGRGLTIERATERLVEDGYLPTGASHDQARDLIKRSLTKPQYTSEGTERMATAELEARQKAYEDAVADIEPLSDNESAQIVDADIPWDAVVSNVSEAEAMRAMGFTEQEIEDATTQRPAIQSQNSEGSSVTNASATAPAKTDYGQRASTQGEDSRSRSDPRRQESQIELEFSATLRSDGTLAIKGDGAAIRQALSDIPKKSLVSMKGGILVGRTQADKAAAILRGEKPKLSAREAAEVGQLAREAEKKATKQTARSNAAASPQGLSIGVMPNSAEPVTVKDGVVHIGKYPAQDFDTGEDVKVQTGATNQQIVNALKQAGVLSSRQRVFGLAKSDTSSNPSDLLSAPTREDVLAQQDRKDNANKLDKKEQIGREAEGQTLTSQTAPEQRTDTSGDMFDAESDAAKRSELENLQKANEEADKNFSNATPAMHRSEAARIEKAANTMAQYPDIKRRYEALAKSHRLTADRKENGPNTMFALGTNGAVTKSKDVVGNTQGGRSADDTTPGTDEATGLPLNSDGTVTVYHHTSAVNAKSIRQTGTLKAQAETDVYVTTRRETDTGYGDTAVPIRVKPDQLTIDDEFPDGRKDFRLNVGKHGGSIKVTVLNESTAPDGGGAFSRGKDQTQTEAFKKWFGDSKVVDADGKPLVVYHGTGRGGHNTFDRNNWKTAYGHFFTPDKSAANYYTHGSASQTFSVYLSAKDPLQLDQIAFGEKPSPQWLDKWIDESFDPENGDTHEQFQGWVGGGDLYSHGMGNLQNDLMATAEENGHDAVAFYDTKGGGGVALSWVVFNSNQVKSATENNGEFDPSNADIRFARTLSPKAFDQKLNPRPASMTLGDVQKAVADLSKTWENGPAIKVVQSPKDLPMRAPVDARGLIHNGTAYVVASNHVSRDDVARTLAHEAIGHYGLWKMLGTDGTRQFERNLQLALKSGNKPLKALSDRVRALYVGEDGKFNLTPAEEANEIAAFAVEDAIDSDGNFKPGYGFMKQAWAKIADFLRNHGFDIKFSNTELQGMLIASMRGLEAGNRLNGGMQGLVAAARSFAKTLAPVSRNPAKTPLYEAMRQLSRFEDSFQTNTSTAKDLADIAKEMTAKMDSPPKFTVGPSTASHQGVRKPTMALTVALKNGNEVKLLDIFESKSERPFVVIGNSDAGQKAGGATAYQIAFAWAHNNGKTMRPDPAGLTVINRLRRTEAMISSAMHYGTTEHLEPHQDQYVALLKRMRNGGAEPEDTHYSSRPDIHGELEALKAKLWTKGNDAATIAKNVQHLIEASTQLAYSREPAIRNFEVVGGELRVRGGREGAISLSNTALADTSGAKEILGVVLRPATTGVGASTLRRAAVLGSVARANQQAQSADNIERQDRGDQRSDVAALKAIREVLGQPDLSASDGLKGVFYARGAQQNAFAPTVWNTPDPTRTDKIIYELQDGRIDLKRVQQAIEQSGQQIEEKWDARLAETIYPGRVAHRSQQFLNTEVHALLKSIAVNKVKMYDLADYLHARGAEERNAQIAKVNPAMPDGGAGKNTKGVLMTTQTARDYLTNITPASKQVLDVLAAKVDAITDGTRKLLVEEGLEKQDTIDAWTKTYKNYVPMFRDEAQSGAPHPQGSGFTVKGSASKRATGSTKEVTNILAHVLMQREAAITRAEKNRVALALYGQALSHPNPDFWTTIKPSMTAAQIGAELQRMGVDPMTAALGMERAPTVTTVDESTGKKVDRPNPLYKSLPGAIPLKVNGEDRVLMLNTENERGARLAENLKNMDGLTAIDWSVGLLHKFVWSKIPASVAVGPATRWLASVNTQYNPVFGLVNVTRDTLGAAVNLSSTELRGKSLKVLRDTMPAMQGIARALATDGGGKWGDLYRQFQADGAQTGYKENFRDANDRAKAIEKELAALQRAGTLNPSRAAHAALDLLDGFNTTMENAVRLSAYSAALDKGMSRAEAARLARELTVDFNRKGRLGREVGPLYAFFNASVQGTARTIETLKGPAGAKIIAAGLGLGVMQAAMLLAAGYDDDEIPEFVKSRSLVIPLNWTGKGEKRHVLIPYPLGLHVLPNTGRVLTELALNGGKNIGKRTFDAIGEIAGAFNPLGGGNIFTADGALKTVAPTLVDPLIELGFNKNFAGGTIEKAPYGGETDTRPGAARAKESTQRSTTGQAYIGISKAFNSLTGGTDYEAGMLSPTPERIRYLAQTVGGGVLREMEKTINASTAASRGEKVKMSQIPLAGRFYGEVNDDQVKTSRYFENSKKIDAVETTMKTIVKAGDSAALDKLQKEHPEIAMIGLGNQVQSAVAKLNKLAVQTINEPETIKQVDANRVEIMDVLNKAVKDLEASTTSPTPGEKAKSWLKESTTP